MSGPKECWSGTALALVPLCQDLAVGARWKPLMTARWLAARPKRWSVSAVPLYLPFFPLLPHCLWEICSLRFGGSCEMMAVCLGEEGQVKRDLSSLILFMAQTQLSPPVTLWLSDSAQKENALCVWPLTLLHCSAFSLLCCCRRLFVPSKLIRLCNDSLHERCTLQFLLSSVASQSDFFLYPRICAATRKRSGRHGEKMALEPHLWRCTYCYNVT